MSYTYENPDIKKNGQRVGYSIAAVVATALITLIMAQILGTPQRILTLFSSIPNPPGGVTWWDKEAVRDGWPTPWWQTVVVTTGTQIEIVDVITASTTFTLVETWDDTILQLTGFITTGGGVISSTGALTWTGSPPTGTLVKAWEVLPASWSTTAITEVLITAGGIQTATVALEYGEPPPTPTPTASPTNTPLPTFTPYATSIWNSGSAQFATTTPCPGGGCDPGVLVDIAYRAFLPVIFRQSP